MKILILGGTRYMGFRCASILFELGNEVITLSRNQIQNKGGWRHLICDRKSYDDLALVIKLEKPDLILDMVCFDKQDAIDIVSIHQLGLLSSLSHYLMVSTFFLYNYFDLRESSFSGAIDSIGDAYTRRKAEAESVLFSSPLFGKCSIVRLPYVFSSNDYSGRFQKFCSLSLSTTITTNGDDYKTSMISMNDAAGSLANILIGSPLGFVDVSNSGCMKLGQIQNIIRGVKGMAPSKPLLEVVQGPYPLSKNLCLNSKKWVVNRSLNDALIGEIALDANINF